MTDQQSPAASPDIDPRHGRLTLAIAALAVAGFDRIWWLVVAGGIATTLALYRYELSRSTSPSTEQQQRSPK